MRDCDSGCQQRLPAHLPRTVSVAFSQPHTVGTDTTLCVVKADLMHIFWLSDELLVHIFAFLDLVDCIALSVSSERLHGCATFLRSVTATRTLFTDQSVTNVQRTFGSLQGLRIADCSGVSHRSFLRLLLTKPGQLQSIALARVQLHVIAGEIPESVLDHTKQVSMLRELSLCGSLWLPSRWLGRIVSCHHSLRQLDLQGALTLNDHDIADIATLKHLKWVRLARCPRISQPTLPAGVEHLDLEECLSLRRIRLRRRSGTATTCLRGFRVASCHAFIAQGLEYITESCDQLEQCIVTGKLHARGPLYSRCQGSFTAALHSPRNIRMKLRLFRRLQQS